MLTGVWVDGFVCGVARPPGSGQTGIMQCCEAVGMDVWWPAEGRPARPRGGVERVRTECGLASWLKSHGMLVQQREGCRRGTPPTASSLHCRHGVLCPDSKGRLAAACTACALRWNRHPSRPPTCPQPPQGHPASSLSVPVCIPCLYHSCWHHQQCQLGSMNPCGAAVPVCCALWRCQGWHLLLRPRSARTQVQPG